MIATSALVKASRIIAVDMNPDKESWARKFGATDFVNPGKLPEGKKIQDYLIELTDGGLDYTFDCTGNVSPPFSHLQLINTRADRSVGSCHALCLGGLPQGLGCQHYHRCCRRWSGDLHPSVRIPFAASQCHKSPTERLVDSSWSLGVLGAVPLSVASKAALSFRASLKVRSFMHRLHMGFLNVGSSDYLQGKVKVDEYVTHHRKLSDLYEGFHDMHVSRIRGDHGFDIDISCRLEIVSAASSTCNKQSHHADGIVLATPTSVK